MAKVNQLLENQTSYKISKETNLPYQTIQDIKNGKTKLLESKFKTVIRLYEYQKQLEKENE
ncbi:hypothetical protein [Staphylococcus pseudintermedius]|uniref:hypothetical protein n=1 Tax=Staphylococcus pseudintermedius TaxID=283734 RepID=UPI001F1D338D|nr:hypothetical protein [Staphylococcus pseudintermedius]MDK3913719.1 hypothetical protein [Staphylococcus pseudintermedius]MDT0967278.1 hypothetical protein [Staphylococcus pseudintermedius]MDU9261219.1 hypothetical protein [Staphylococcus pseudintermedius]MDU9332483.1 hypothetical protein [Staphylococcus pseudintermedius]UAS73062.2 hypothetical protein K9E83_04840 [Staphylococcus pseudintermedius]